MTPAPPPRITYRHGDLHRALLDAGIALANAGGPEAVILREATRRAGVAPNAAYRHFASRQDLLQAVRSAPLPLPDGTLLSLSVSVGVAHVVAGADDQRALYSAADAALHEAKRAGRGRVGRGLTGPTAGEGVPRPPDPVG